MKLPWKVTWSLHKFIQSAFCMLYFIFLWGRGGWGNCLMRIAIRCMELFSPTVLEVDICRYWHKQRGTGSESLNCNFLSKGWRNQTLGLYTTYRMSPNKLPTFWNFKRVCFIITIIFIFYFWWDFSKEKEVSWWRIKYLSNSLTWGIP